MKNEKNKVLEKEAEKKHEVQIRINNEPFTIRQGRHSVVDIKTLGHVPQTDVLAEVKDKELVRLPDDSFVVIRGHEIFKSHPRSGGSS